MLHIVVGLLVALFGLIATGLWSRRKKVVLSNASEFLCLLNENKIFPIVGGDRWHLDEVAHGVRKWRRLLVSDYQKACLEVSASYDVVNRPFQVVEAVLKNCKAKSQWNAGVPTGCKFRIFARRRDAKVGCSVTPSRRSSLESEDYSSEEVRLSCSGGSADPDRRGRGWRNWVGSTVDSLVMTRSYERCWSRSSDKEFWLLENTANFRSFIFYLLNWNEESSCLLTVLVGKESSIFWDAPDWIKLLTFHSGTGDCPSLLLAGLNDYLTLDVAASNQTLSLSTDDVDSSAPSTDAHSSSGSSESGSVRRKSAQGKPEPVQAEVSFFQKIRNMIDDKREGLEAKPKKGGVSLFLQPGESQTHEPPSRELDSPINPMDIIKRFSLSAKFFDDKKNESESEGNPKADSMATRKRWSIQPEVISSRTPEEKVAKKLLHRTHSVASADLSTDVDADLLQCLETMIDNAALDIIAEKCKVANLDIKARSEEQASRSGGWIYCGLEKDTVILKKVSSDDSVPLHSYIGKGMVSHPPKLVYEVLRCPTRRVAYDDMVKNVEILRELEGGMKIVRLLYEVGQHFRREVREFVVLQGERIEGMKHVITLQSVDWSSLSSSLCPAQEAFADLASDRGSGWKRSSAETSSKGKAPPSPTVGLVEGKRLPKVARQPQMIEGVVPAKMFSSGWIIEPVLKANKLCSMITYISQMKLDTGARTALSYLAEDIALKQPLCIVHLRHYLATLDAEDDLLASSSDVDCKRSGKSVTLSISNALARFRNHTPSERPDDSDHDVVV